VGNDAGDWQSRVNAILDANLHRRVNGRVASKRTMEHNRTVINHAFQTWHNKLNHQIKVPQNLTDRHVQVLVRYWYEEGKAASTMRGDLSVIRKFFGWMGKKGVVRPLEEYLPDAPAERIQVRGMGSTGNKSKSWSANGIDVEKKLQEAFALDERFGIILAMQLAFGYRRKETICIRPWLNDLRPHSNAFMMYERDGTKGGRRRLIPIEFPFQAWILDYAKSRIAKRSNLGWPKTRRGDNATLKQNIERYKSYMKKLGISKSDVSVTGHGLRGEYSENCGLLRGFVPASLGGKANQMPRDDLKILQRQVSENLGHSRASVTERSYYGKPAKGDPTDGYFASKALVDAVRKSARAVMAARDNPDARTVIILCVDRHAKGYLQVVDMALMLTNRRYIPCESSFEIQMADALEEGGRSFALVAQFHAITIFAFAEALQFATNRRIGFPRDNIEIKLVVELQSPDGHGLSLPFIGKPELQGRWVDLAYVLCIIATKCTRWCVANHNNNRPVRSPATAPCRPAFSALYRLTKRSARLVALGVSLGGSLDERWQNFFAALENFVRVNGHARVSQRYVTPEGVRLGVLLATQKKAYQRGSMSPEREARLLGLGVQLVVTSASGEEQWETMFAVLETFSRENGHANVPRWHLTAKGKRLGHWFHRQKEQYSKGRLSPERESRLRALGVQLELKAE
jgi:site-specific recombinase XerD